MLLLEQRMASLELNSGVAPEQPGTWVPKWKFQRKMLHKGRRDAKLPPRGYTRTKKGDLFQ